MYNYYSVHVGIPLSAASLIQMKSYFSTEVIYNFNYMGKTGDVQDNYRAWMSKKRMEWTIKGQLPNMKRINWRYTGHKKRKKRTRNGGPSDQNF